MAPKVTIHFEVVVARSGAPMRYSAEKYTTVQEAREECNRLLKQGERWTAVNTITVVNFVEEVKS